jgi:hypothetical protein
MHEIKEYKYSIEHLDEIRNYRFGDNWPVVYILEDGREAYIGQTVNAYRRAKEHIEKPERKKLSKAYIIADQEYNKSVVLDFESSLIKYMAGDGKYFLQNGNKGLSEHDYFDRKRYEVKFKTIWKELQNIGLVKQDILDIENSDLFKFSPYKTLSADQLEVAETLLEYIKVENRSRHLVSGEPGTGKTVLATYLVKRLLEEEKKKELNVGLVIPMSALRKTLGQVFKKIKGLKVNMVIGPNDVVKKDYDILIVDEAHRLQRRQGIQNVGAFDKVNEKLGLDKYEGNQLDWMMLSAKHVILFYDPNQTIRPADVRAQDFNDYNFVRHRLSSQMRVEGGQDYLDYINDIFDNKKVQRMNFYEYDFKLFEDIHEMIDEVKKKNKKDGLCRVVAGYAWKWQTKEDDSLDYDIDIDGLKLKWNSMTKDWVNSENAINEVGCIHTIQGYDLNYTGVIVGPEFGYNLEKGEFFIDSEKYKDRSGYIGVENEEELFEYIKNIYKTLLTRGIKGTYVYVSDEGLKKYLSRYVVTHLNN